MSISVNSIGNRVLEKFTTIGTGTIELSGRWSAVHRTFAEEITSGTPVECVLVDNPDAETIFEISQGVYTAGSPGTITRATFVSSSTGSFINWAGGTKAIGIFPTKGLFAGVYPTGAGMPFFGTVLPPGFLWCNGASYSTTTKESLFNVIGYTYGGSGANFNVPDLRCTLPMGVDAMGGTAIRGLVTEGGSGIDAKQLGVQGGTETVTLDISEIPQHSHTHTGFPDIIDVSGSGSFSARRSNTTTNDTSAIGGGGPHRNMPPVMACNYIIKD